MPFGAAAIPPRFVLSAALGSEREGGHGSAVAGVASFRIGTDEADQIDVVLVHVVFPFVARICRGTQKARAPLPSRRERCFGQGPKLVLGTGVQTRQSAQQERE